MAAWLECSVQGRRWKNDHSKSNGKNAGRGFPVHPARQNRFRVRRWGVELLVTKAGYHVGSCLVAFMLEKSTTNTLFDGNGGLTWLTESWKDSVSCWTLVWRLKRNKRARIKKKSINRFKTMRSKWSLAVDCNAVGRDEVWCHSLESGRDGCSVSKKTLKKKKVSRSRTIDVEQAKFKRLEQNKTTYLWMEVSRRATCEGRMVASHEERET